MRAKLPHDDFHPVLKGRMIRGSVAMGFIRRAQKSFRLSTPLKQLSPKGTMVQAPGPSARGAKVKVWVAKSSTTAGHLKYLEHEKGIDGMDAQLFDAHGTAVDRKAFAERAKDDPHQFRLMLSPADAKLLDLERYARAYMAQVDRDVRTPIDWVGAVHFDTPAHPHVHVMIRGRDLDGRDLYLMKDYLTRGLTYRAQEIATDFLGPLEPREYGLTRTYALEGRNQDLADAVKGEHNSRRLTPDEVTERLSDIQLRVEQMHERWQCVAERWREHHAEHQGIER